MPDGSTTSVIEEQYDGEVTGLELEDTRDGDGEHTPWDPDLIRVSTKTFSLRNILDMIEEGGLELAPDSNGSTPWVHRCRRRRSATA